MSNHSFWSPTSKVNGWQPNKQIELYHHGVKGMKWGVRRTSARQSVGTDAGGGGTIADPEYLEWKKKHPEENISYEEWKRRNASADAWFNKKVNETIRGMTPGDAYKYGVVYPLEYSIETRMHEANKKSIGDTREGDIQGRDWHYESAIEWQASGGRTGPARNGPADNYEENFLREKRAKETGQKVVDTTNSALDKKHNAEKQLVKNTKDTVDNTVKERKKARTGAGRLIRK